MSFSSGLARFPEAIPAASRPGTSSWAAAVCTATQYGQVFATDTVGGHHLLLGPVRLTGDQEGFPEHGPGRGQHGRVRRMQGQRRRNHAEVLLGLSVDTGDEAVSGTGHDRGYVPDLG